LALLVITFKPKKHMKKCWVTPFEQFYLASETSADNQNKRIPPWGCKGIPGMSLLAFAALAIGRPLLMPAKMVRFCLMHAQALF
jgi:hypothetical protein